MERLWTPEEARDFMGFKSTHSVYRRIKSGELPAIKLSATSIRLRPEDVAAYLEGNSTKAAER